MPLTRLLALFLISMLSACGPKIKASLSVKEATPIGKYATVVVFGVDEAVPKDAKLMGYARATDTGLTIYCPYDYMIERLKQKARAVGANAIKVTRHRKPDRLSTCDRIDGELYYLSDIGNYEDAIIWTGDRKLTWNDFKKTNNDYSTTANDDARVSTDSAGAVTVCSFYVEWQEGKPKAFAKFDTRQSWVGNITGRNAYVLGHEQTHFDICELYTRRIRQDISKLKDDTARRFLYGDFETGYNAVQKIVDHYQSLYEDRQRRYDLEAGHGINHLAQQRWTKDINKELADLEAYALK